MIWEMTWKIPWGLTLVQRQVEACTVSLRLAVYLQNALHVVLTLGYAPIVTLDKPHKFLKFGPVKV
jgi:hypothetical protein